jgi:hypothetical protein
MGHERVGALPKTKKWERVVRDIAGFNGEEYKSRQIANAALDNVRSRFEFIQRDAGVHTAFKFLTGLAVSGTGGTGVPDLRLPDNPTPFAVARALNTAVEANKGSTEYAAIASAAAADAIANWYAQNSEQPSLFGSSEQNAQIWRKAGTAGGFCEIARLFFAKFTERYLNYFLEREASAVSKTIERRDMLQNQLRSQIDSVSRHAFETARIAQSFAAGWYNRHASEAMPTDDEIAGFLAIAFGKIREDLRREKTE